MWFDGSLYVAAPPSIWKLTDTDDDGVADRREEWFQGKTLTGCANDLHGPYLGPDGWIYWTKGAFAEQTYERPGKAPLVTRASHIFRRRPGHTAIEPVMTGGMDNPGRRRVHALGRADSHGDLPRTSAARTARRDRARDLRRRLRQAARGDRRPCADRGSDAGDVAPRPGRALRSDQVLVGRLRRGISRQLLRDDVQPAEGDPATCSRRAAPPSRTASPISWSRPIATSIRPMSSRMPTAACS